MGCVLRSRSQGPQIPSQYQEGSPRFWVPAGCGYRPRSSVLPGRAGNGPGCFFPMTGVCLSGFQVQPGFQPAVFPFSPGFLVDNRGSVFGDALLQAGLFLARFVSAGLLARRFPVSRPRRPRSVIVLVVVPRRRSWASCRVRRDENITFHRWGP